MLNKQSQQGSRLVQVPYEHITLNINGKPWIVDFTDDSDSAALKTEGSSESGLGLSDLDNFRITIGVGVTQLAFQVTFWHELCHAATANMSSYSSGTNSVMHEELIADAVGHAFPDVIRQLKEIYPDLFKILTERPKPQKALFEKKQVKKPTRT